EVFQRQLAARADDGPQCLNEDPEPSDHDWLAKSVHKTQANRGGRLYRKDTSVCEQKMASHERQAHIAKKVRTHAESNPESHGPVARRTGVPRCRMRDDPTTRRKRNGADAGGGGLSHSPRGYARAAGGSSVEGAASDREPHQGQQRRVHVCRFRQLPLCLCRWREGVFRVRASQGDARSARGREFTVRRCTRRGAVNSQSNGRPNRSRRATSESVLRCFCPRPTTRPGYPNARIASTSTLSGTLSSAFTLSTPPQPTPFGPTPSL